MILSAPTLTRGPDGVRYTVRVRETKADVPEELWFEVPTEAAEYLSEQADAAVLGLLVPAMEAGEPLHAEGRVSRQLLTALNEAYQPMLLPVMPHLKVIRVTAATLTDEPAEGAREVATGYSGGVDSFTTLLRPRTEPERPVSLLIHNNVGAHGSGDRGDAIFRERLKRARHAAGRLGLPLVSVDSNLDRFYGRQSGFIATHSVRNVAAVMALQRKVAVYEYSSGHPRARQVVRAPGDIARIDEASLPLLATESFRTVPTGAEYTRLEKLLLVSGHPVTYGLLDVCIQPRQTHGRINCSACVKCLRAQFLFECAGRLEHYREVFDLRRWRSRRNFQIASMLRGQLDQPDEILRYARENGLRIPFASRLLALPGIYQAAKAFHRLSLRLPAGPQAGR